MTWVEVRSYRKEDRQPQSTMVYHTRMYCYRYKSEERNLAFRNKENSFRADVLVSGRVMNKRGSHRSESTPACCTTIAYKRRLSSTQERGSHTTVRLVHAALLAAPSPRPRDGTDQQLPCLQRCNAPGQCHSGLLWRSPLCSCDRFSTSPLGGNGPRSKLTMTTMPNALSSLGL